MKVKGKKPTKNKTKYNGKKYRENYYSDFDRLIMENPKKTQKERDLQNKKLAKLLEVKPRAKLGPSKKSYVVQGKKKVCAILGCVESQTWPDTEFYAFPKDEKYRKLWSELTGRVNWLPDTNSVVCGSHFSMDSHVWEETGGVRVAVRLAHDAVPSFNLPPQVMEVQFVEDVDFDNVPVETFSTKQTDTDYIPTVVPRKKDPIKKTKEPKKKIEGVDKVRLFQTVQRYQNKLIEQYKNLRELNRSIKSQAKQIEHLNRQLKEKKEEHEEKKAKLNKMQEEWDNETNAVKNDNELILMMPSRYSEDMKNLALSIHNYSPEAYIYLRNTLRTVLPATDLLRKWTDSGFRPKTKITSSDAIKLVTESSESEFTCNITIQ